MHLQHLKYIKYTIKLQHQHYFKFKHIHIILKIGLFQNSLIAVSRVFLILTQNKTSLAAVQEKSSHMIVLMITLPTVIMQLTLLSKSVISSISKVSTCCKVKVMSLFIVCNQQSKTQR